jgi:hypothetical protein
MLARRSGMLDQGTAIAEAEHRIRLLVILAHAHARLGQTEEMQGAFRECARARGELTSLRVQARVPTLLPIET